jgi:hypothetical protein
MDGSERMDRIERIDRTDRNGAREALYALPAISYLRLRCTLSALDHARLPGYKGSLLRGAFGHALRALVCTFGPAQACDSCRLRAACVHTRLFETFVEDEPPPFLRGLPTSPRPYIFEPHDERREVCPGAELCFDLVLIGQAADLHPYAILAVERMASAGLGRDRYRFRLERVESLGPDGSREEVSEAGRWAPARAVRCASATTLMAPAAEPAPDRATLCFLTPTRIKIRDHLVPSIGVRPLVFAMLRRTLELAHFHMPGAAVDWSFHALLQHAGNVAVRASDLRWHDWQRYSNRQRTTMSMGGFIGSLEVEGDLAPLWPLFRAAEILHVGKGCTFGLGKVAVTRQI